VKLLGGLAIQCPKFLAWLEIVCRRFTVLPAQVLRRFLGSRLGRCRGLPSRLIRGTLPRKGLRDQRFESIELGIAATDIFQIPPLKRKKFGTKRRQLQFRFGKLG
jgi:hypothetical protein